MYELCLSSSSLLVTHFFSSFSLSLSSFPMLAEIIILLFWFDGFIQNGFSQIKRKKQFLAHGWTMEKSGWCIRCQQIYTHRVRQVKITGGVWVASYTYICRQFEPWPACSICKIGLFYTTSPLYSLWRLSEI